MNRRGAAAELKVVRIAEVFPAIVQPGLITTIGEIRTLAAMSFAPSPLVCTGVAYKR